MPQIKLSKLELQILEALWAQGKASVREIQETFREPRPAYTTIQTTVYRLENKKAMGAAPAQDRQCPHFRTGHRPRCYATSLLG